jgi:uncharacterized protein (TIGR02217 family)
MVASSIPIDAVYLDGTVENVLGNAVSTIEDNTAVVTTDNGLVNPHERWDRVKNSWNLSWGPSSSYVQNLFTVCRTSRGFLLVSPLAYERVATGQLLRNTVTGLNLGDGSTTTFQLQVISSTTAHSVVRDVSYPLTGTLVAYKNGVSATATVNLTTGVVTFGSAPGSGVVPTADFQYAWPVKFTSTSISTTWLETDHVEVRSAQIEEIF